MRCTRLNLWCCGRRRGQFRLERSPAVCGIWPVTHREVVPPAQRGPGTVRRPPGGLGGASGTPPERFRACSALANPHGVTHHPEVRQGEQGHQLYRVLCQSPVPHLHVPELAFHHPERMLHPGPHLRLHPFRQRHRRSRLEQPALPRSHRDVPRRLRCDPPVHRPRFTAPGSPPPGSPRPRGCPSPPRVASHRPR